MSDNSPNDQGRNYPEDMPGSDSDTANKGLLWFQDLNEYIALPRLNRLILSSDGHSLVCEMQQLNEKKTRYISSLWLLDPDGKKPIRRLTQSTQGESSATFYTDDEILFLSSRPTPDATHNDADTVAAIWKISLSGGEASVVAHRLGGFTGIYTAKDSSVIAVMANVFPEAKDELEDEKIRKERKETPCSAIVHTSVAVRYWDHDLGPDVPHILTGKLVQEDYQEKITFIDQTPHVTDQLHTAQVSIAPGGEYMITTWVVAHGLAQLRRELRYVDLRTGNSYSVLSDAGADLSSPEISPDGNWLSFTRTTFGSPDKCQDVNLYVISTAHLSSPTTMDNAHILTATWDRWVSEYIWRKDSRAVILVADDNGRAPIYVRELFAVNIDAINVDANNVNDASNVNDAIEITADAFPIQVTYDDYAYSQLNVDPQGKCIYALRSSYCVAPHPVCVDMISGRVVEIPTLHQSLELPGAVTDVSTTLDDGTKIRGWLLTPRDISHDNPAPLLLVIHGGPLSSWNSWSWRWNPWLLVAHGYAVLLPDPALSTGYGLDFIQRGWNRWGKEPYTDLMAITDHVLSRDDIDSDNSAALGGSFGGYMANWIAGHTSRFKAIVTHASLWALDQFHATTDAPWYWPRMFSGHSLHENSPHNFVHNIVTPMLVIHGDKDYRVPIGEGLRLWNDVLTNSGIPIDAQGNTVHKFLYFPDENHWILKPQNAKFWYQEVLAFLDTHMNVHCGNE